MLSLVFRVLERLELRKLSPNMLVSFVSCFISVPCIFRMCSSKCLFFFSICLEQGLELDDFVSGPRELLLKLVEEYYPLPDMPDTGPGLLECYLRLFLGSTFLHAVTVFLFENGYGR